MAIPRWRIHHAASRPASHVEIEATRGALDPNGSLDYTVASMQPFHAVVKNGRLTLDEATDLPEGQVVVLLSVEELFSLGSLGDAEDGEPFAVVPPPREWREPKPVDARALIDELRSL